MYFRIRYNLPLDMLIKVDRMSMATSLEVRAPLLDVDLFEASTKIPDKYGGTEFAQSAEERLFQKVVTKTHIDSALFLFRQAEKDFLEQNDVAAALKKYDVVAHEYSGTRVAAKAELCVAWIYENVIYDNEAAKENYKLLLENYPENEYGKFAKKKLEALQKAEFSAERRRQQDGPDD